MVGMDPIFSGKGNYAPLRRVPHHRGCGVPNQREVAHAVPREKLAKGPGLFNFHLSQLRVKIEQSFGILVSTWGILWRPLSVGFAGRTDLIVARFQL